jgi:hypothetical protein
MSGRAPKRVCSAAVPNCSRMRGCNRKAESLSFLNELYPSKTRGNRKAVQRNKALSSWLTADQNSSRFEEPPYPNSKLQN